MDQKIKLQVDKIVVHKRIHEYLQQLPPKQPVKEENPNTPPSHPPEVKQESHGSSISPQ